MMLLRLSLSWYSLKGALLVELPTGGGLAVLPDADTSRCREFFEYRDLCGNFPITFIYHRSLR